LYRYGIKVKLFADDVKLYLQILNYVHVLQLHQAVDALVVAWVNEWQLSISVNKYCVLNVGKVTYSTCFSIDGLAVSGVASAHDFGVIVSRDLSPSLHISNIVAKAHKRTPTIYRAFRSRNADLLIRADLTYVRPLVEHDSVIWSPYTVKDIEAFETVQRRFTKRLPTFSALND